MQNKLIPIMGSREAIDGLSSKMAYNRPVLRVYGAISKLITGSQTTGTDGGASTMFNPSDLAIKENIVRIGDHPLGIGLYLFDYKPEFREQWGHGRQFGVMAQEVEKVMPEAVSFHAKGYMQVNYALLGISHRIQ